MELVIVVIVKYKTNVKLGMPLGPQAETLTIPD